MISKNNEQIYFSHQQKNISFAFVSNINIEPFFDKLIKKKFAFLTTSFSIEYFDYNEFFLLKNSQLENFDFIIVFLNFENLQPNFGVNSFDSEIDIQELKEMEITRFDQICSKINKNSKSKIIWFSYENYCYKTNKFHGNIFSINAIIDEINILLYKRKNDITEIIDFKKIIAEVGLNKSFNDKNKFRWNSPYSEHLLERVAEEIQKQYLISLGISKKCIILDCDNVLWGGIISEDGLTKLNISCSGIGKKFQEFQKYLLYLYSHGVILAICSKNYFSDIIEMFSTHDEMILKKEHISNFQVNWDNKVDNIIKIAEILNIELDSIIFIDDSDYEINLIKEILPDVSAIKFEYPKVLDELTCLNLKCSMDKNQIIQRNITFKTNEERFHLKKQASSYEQYLESLNMKIDIHKAYPVEIARIAELTQRVNKCTNGTRYSIEQLKNNLSKKSFILYSVFLSDKFSNLGLVGAFAINNNHLDLFCLSCRALGRNVEDYMLEYIQTKYKIKEFHFESTKRNKDIQNKLLSKFN